MSSYAVEFTRRANVQIRHIFSYIAENNPDAALKMVDSLETKARRLEDTPFLGAELPQNEYPFLQPGYRRLIANPFIMYYRVITQVSHIQNSAHTLTNQ